MVCHLLRPFQLIISVPFLLTSPNHFPLSLQKPAAGNTSLHTVSPYKGPDQRSQLSVQRYVTGVSSHGLLKRLHNGQPQTLQISTVKGNGADKNTLG
ncbi:hypothetical protein QQF64_018830 [Cirrhinus molitorella]|uniref:Uncharacterized protein n=1 Tax=Cirrhinus molitorella TaxID=172907 RepID=A0ABR3LH60_9TELE